MRDLSLRAGASRLRVLTYGARLAELRLGGVSIVLTYPSDAANEDDAAWLNAALGRTSGRIKDARLTIGGATHDLDANAGEDHLHGGAKGFGHVDWAVERHDEAEAVLTLASPAGDQGYPGRLDARCRLSLTEDSLVIAYEARADAPTPVGLSHHPYYRLGGDVTEHALRVNADRFVPLDADGLPTGELRTVAGTPLDLREERPLSAVLADLAEPLDHCLVCESGRVDARLSGPSGAVRITADQPCLQVYGAGKLGAPLHAGGGLALEPQAYPDAERCGFPSRILAPGEAWARTTVIALD